MNIAIIGAGYTGLSAGLRLIQKGHSVTVFESDKHPGGLAVGFKMPHWTWSLEKHYHHWFTNDDQILDLASSLRYPVIKERPKTAIYIKNSIYQMDSPRDVLLFPHLSLVDRVRMAGVLGFLRVYPFWKSLESTTADSFLRQYMGKDAYKEIWEPQLSNKFGSYKDQISLAWFWARIHKRTASLMYPHGGFLQFAEKMSTSLSSRGGTVLFNAEVTRIDVQKNVQISFKKDKSKQVTRPFDKVIVTMPGYLFSQIAPQLPQLYKESITSLKGIGAVNLVLRLRKPFLVEGTYWLSICMPGSPVMAAVEHTNFIDKRYYANEHILYLGNYVPHEHEYFQLTPRELLKRFSPFLKNINPTFEENIIDIHLFKSPFAQPIITPYYSSKIPPIKTPLPNVYLANIQQVYPWDRGTNYAVELGDRVADLILYEHSN